VATDAPRINRLQAMVVMAWEEVIGSIPIKSTNYSQFSKLSVLRSASRPDLSSNPSLTKRRCGLLRAYFRRAPKMQGYGAGYSEPAQCVVGYGLRHLIRLAF
jgi:hypothetical protein